MIILIVCVIAYFFTGGFLAEYIEAKEKEVTIFAFIWPIIFVIAAGRALYEMAFNR